MNLPTTAATTTTPTIGGGGLFDDLPTHTGPQRRGEVLDDRYTRGSRQAHSPAVQCADVELSHRTTRDSSERSSCYEKVAPHGIAIGLGNGEAFYIDLENFDDAQRGDRRSRDILTNGFLYKQAHRR